MGLNAQTFVTSLKQSGVSGSRVESAALQCACPNHYGYKMPTVAAGIPLHMETFEEAIKEEEKKGISPSSLSFI